MWERSIIAPFLYMSIFLATCGPTGIGKTYQMQRLLQARPELFTSMRSVTTRPTRGSEDDAWYRCITREQAATIDPADILTDMQFRDERYLTLRSELDQALTRAPIVFMAIVPWIIKLLREKQFPHSVICCRVGDEQEYERRLRTRGYLDERLQPELQGGLGFDYPAREDGWPQEDVFLGSPDDDARFDAVVVKLSGGLFVPSSI